MVQSARGDGVGRVIGIIPARAGSKGVPGKNLRNLAGSPLLAWIIAAATRAKTLDELYVSTDYPLGVLGGLVLGLDVISRPTTLAQDSTPDLPVFRDIAKRLLVRRGMILVHLRPTAPFVRPGEIDEVVRELIKTGAYTVRSVVRARDHPQKCYLGDRVLEPATQHNKANHPRQGLPLAWRAAGFVDAHRASNILSGRTMDGKWISKWEAPADRAVDLDTEADWAAAERLALERGWKPGEIT